MILTLMLLVSVDAKGRTKATLPFTEVGWWSGRSIARLLDDITLDLMARVPGMAPDEIAQLAFCPTTEVRRTHVAFEIPASSGVSGSPNDAIDFRGKVSCILRRWPHEDFWEATVPHLGAERFALKRPSQLSTGIIHFLRTNGRQRGRDWLLQAAPATQDSLELLEVPVDLPTPLPSERPRPKARGATSARRKRRKAQSEESEKRKLVPPHRLSEVGEAWTHRALDGRLARAHRREAVVAEVWDQLRRPGAAILLVGPSGCGKTAVVQEIAHRLVAESSGPLDRRDIWSVDSNRLIAGMSFVGAWEDRVAGMVGELIARQDVLYVADLPGLVFAGRSSHSDSNIAQFLDPHLARGEIRILGECTAERLEAVREEFPGFFQRFRVIRLEEMSDRDSLLVLAHEARRVSEARDLVVAPDTYETILALTRRFENHTALPGRAASVLQRVLAERQREKEDELGRPCLPTEAVFDHYADRTGLPDFVLRPDRGRPPEEVREFFERRIVGQPEAVDTCCQLVLRIQQGLADPERPFGTYLFVGPTGVGKTETAKVLAYLLFGATERLIRLDMSEFQAPWSATRLFGGPGRADGELTARVARQPFSVVLLDEIEKAHTSVFDALLQVLGEGRLTNAAGHTVSFRSCIVIMTSNLGVRTAERRLGFEEEGVEQMASRYRSAAEAFFRPELFNRIDQVVPFRRLTRAVILPLSRRLLASILGRRGLAQTETLVDIDINLPDQLVDRGFDPRYGARSMRRLLEAELAVPLAEHLVRTPSGGLSLIELRAGPGGAIDLSVDQPERAWTPSEPLFEPCVSWEAFDHRLQTVHQQWERFRASPTVDQLGTRRRELLEQYNQDTASPAEQEELRSLSGPLDALPSLGARIEELEDRSSTPQFEESVTVQVQRGWEDVDEQQPLARPARYVRGPFPAALGRALFDIELDLMRLQDASLAHVEGGARSALLAIRPLGGEEESRRLCLAILSLLADALGAKAPHRVTQAFTRTSDGWRSGMHEEFTALGLELRAPDAVARASAESGIWVARTTRGLARGTTAARVEEVGRPDQDPVSSLSAKDGLRPSQPLSIIRWFDDEKAIDPESGCTLHLGDPQSLDVAWLVKRKAKVIT